ncbi:UNVERIFIED_CONTAM: hypothetical protein FKN15_003848 [Acipenser sinensis]
MKSEVPSNASLRHEHLKGALANPEPMEAAKSFPADVEMISSKVGSEFAPLWAEARHRQLREVNGGCREQDKGLPGRKKRKSQQAGPSDTKEVRNGAFAPHPRHGLEGRSEEDNESSLSDCASSPSSSLQFGDSDTISSSEEEQDKAGAVRPMLGRTRGARPHKWPRPEPEAVLMKRPCLHGHRTLQRKHFVKATGSSQRTQKQKEQLLLQRKKREVFARRKYALLQSTSSSSENELTSHSSSTSSTDGEEELYVDVSSSSSHPSSTAGAPGILLHVFWEADCYIVTDPQSRSAASHSRSHWGPNSSSQNRPQEPRSRNRISTVIQPLRQSAAEVVDLTVDEDDPTIVPSTSAVANSQCVSSTSNNASTSEQPPEAALGPSSSSHASVPVTVGVSSHSTAGLTAGDPTIVPSTSAVANSQCVSSTSNNASTSEQPPEAALGPSSSSHASVPVTVGVSSHSTAGLTAGAAPRRVTPPWAMATRVVSSSSCTGIPTTSSTTSITTTTMCTQPAHSPRCPSLTPAAPWRDPRQCQHPAAPAAAQAANITIR